MTDYHAQAELEAERQQKALLLLDKVARGEGTLSVAEELAREMGIRYQPIRKHPVPQMDGTCNPF